MPYVEIKIKCTEETELFSTEHDDVTSCKLARSKKKMNGSLLIKDNLYFDHISLIGKTWNYRGEGNANIVVSLPQESVVIRLPKYSTTNDVNNKLNRMGRVAREVLYCQNVMIPLLGSCYVYPCIAAELQLSEVKELMQNLSSFRPNYRKIQATVSEYATIYSDYTLLPKTLRNDIDSVYCIEIKPKHGFISAFKSQSLCTFCVKQYWKLEQGLISAGSNYCPLDLFSGDQTRMEKAIKSLIINPQNNFKLFKDGTLIYGEGNENVDNFYKTLRDWFKSSDANEDQLKSWLCCLVIDALLRDLSEENLISLTDIITNLATIDNDNNSISGCDKKYQKLPKNCVLDRILNLQRLEVPIDIDLNIEQLDDYSYLSSLLCDSGKLKSPLHRYLLSTTAKDCSILMAFQKLNLNSQEKICEKYISKMSINGPYVFNACISDLDPKPSTCITRHKKRDLALWNSYEKIKNNRMLCKPQ